MELRWKLIIIFFLLLSLSYVSLLSDEITTFEFYDSKMTRIKHSQYKRFPPAKDVMNELKEVLKRAKTCLQTKTYESIKEDLKSRPLKIQISRDIGRKCGETWQLTKLSGSKGKLMMLSADFWDNDDINDYNKGCGCLKSKLFHELLHWSSGLGDSFEEEVEAYSCELKCFGSDVDKNCPVIPNEYKDHADPKKCCK